jgi:hypothetical protein
MRRYGPEVDSPSPYPLPASRGEGRRSPSPGLLAAAVASLVAAASARGDAPYLASDPDPVAAGRWVVRLASQATFDADGLSATAPQLELEYGALADLQLHFVAPLAIAEQTGFPARYGPGDVAFGAKVRFVDQPRGDVRVQIATYPSVTVPTGSSASGLGAGRATAFLPIWAETSAGALRTYGGGGFRTATSNAPSGSFFFAWVIERRFGPAALGAEIFHEVAAQREGLERTGFSVGAGVDVSAVHHLLLSFGAGGRDRDLHAYLGWELALGHADALPRDDRSPR